MLSIQTLVPSVSRPRIVPSAITGAASGSLAVVGLAHLALLALQARLTWGHPHYRFFPVLLVGVGVIARRAVSQLGPLVPGPDRPVRWMLGGAWALLVGACLIGSAWLGTVAAMLATLGVAFAIGGERLLRSLLPAWGLLWLAIPPPIGLDYELVALLQATATRWSSRVLDVLGVFHLRQGNVIRLADRRLLIEEACSGIHSLFAVLAATLFLAIWGRRSPLRGLALVATAVAWVFLGNVLRIVVVVDLAARWHIDLSTSWPHEALGLAVFALALGLTASTDCLLSLLVWLLSLRRAWVEQSLIGRFSVPPPPRPAPPPQATQVSDRGWSRIASWRLVAAYGAVILAQPLFIRSLLEDYFLPGPVAACRLLDLRATDLPAASGALWQEGFESLQRQLGSDDGRFSERWRYRWGERTVNVSLDGPFQGWHELTRCYLSNGWTSRGRSVQTEGADKGGAVAVVRLERPLDRHAELLFSLFDEWGHVLEPDNFGGRRGFLSEVVDFWRRQSRQRTYQLQLLVEGPGPLTPAERSVALRFFHQVRSELVVRIAHDGPELVQ
jgi:exosortase